MFARHLAHWLSLLILFSATTLEAESDSLKALLLQSSQLEKGKLSLELAQYFMQSEHDSAVHYANKALQIAQQFNNINLQVRSYTTLAESHQHRFNNKESVAFYWKAIELAERNNENAALGTAYNGLGIVHYYMSDLPKAEQYIKLGAAAKLKANDYMFYSIILINLAAIYFHNEQYSEAIQLLKSTESVLLKNQQEKYLASLYNSLGANYQVGKQLLDSAEYYYNKSLELAIAYHLTDNIIAGYHNLSEVSQLKNHFDKSIGYLLTAEDFCKSTNNEHHILAVYTALSQVYEKLKNYQKAFYYKNLQLELSNTIHEKEARKAINELEIKYQTAQKERKFQEQKEEAQMLRLNSERARNRFITLLFIATTLLFLTGFVAYYFWQRKNANQRLEKEKSKIFENIVHEIRTPLTLIHGPLQLVKEATKNAQPIQQHLVQIENNSDKLIRLVSELLYASKLETGKYQLAYQLGDPVSYVKGILKSFEQEALTKKIGLQYIYPESQGTYRYASNALEKIISNLLSNAIKYSPPNSQITVELRLDGHCLLLDVSDQGPGIPIGEQQRIFDRFHRLANHAEVSGFGIGLSMVKELMQLLQGDLTIHSSAGNGTTFTCSIPITKYKPPLHEPLVDDSKPLLLVVEDEQEIGQFVRAVFENDFNVLLAHNGLEGMEKVVSHLPDIVLSDIMMPSKDGLELLQEIKTNELSNHIPVVVFSAKASLESRLQGLRYGADAYLPKPVSPEEMRLVIQNLLKTIQRNQQDFQQNKRSEKPFDERIKNSNEFVNSAIRLVILNLDRADYSVNELASDLCMSRSQLHRKLTALTGLSATNFIKMVRLEKAKDLLKSQWGNVTEIAYACGFNSQSYFSKSFSEYFGKSPSDFFQ